MSRVSAGDARLIAYRLGLGELYLLDVLGYVVCILEGGAVGLVNGLHAALESVILRRLSIIVDSVLPYFCLSLASIDWHEFVCA